MTAAPSIRHSTIENRQLPAKNLLPLGAKLFGIDSFRPLQREAIEASLAGLDSLAIMATGSGKSLCYQLPAVAESGLTLVVSPLIALMNDQIMALKEQGVAAECVHSGLHWRSHDEMFRAAKDGRLHLLYVSPERCDDPAFLAILCQCDLRSIVIDEAHCISIWGPDFRPAYAKLGQLRVLFPDVPIAGFTATATARVRGQIKESLMLRKPVELIGDFDRPNLTLRVIPSGDPGLLETVRRLHLQFVIRNSSFADGIVYCPTHAETERVAAMLTHFSFCGEGLPIEFRPYHAGLSPKERRSVHEWFVQPLDASTLEPCESSSAGPGSIDNRQSAIGHRQSIPRTRRPQGLRLPRSRPRHGRRTIPLQSSWPQLHPHQLLQRRSNRQSAIGNPMDPQAQTRLSLVTRWRELCSQNPKSSRRKFANQVSDSAPIKCSPRSMTYPTLQPWHP